MDVGLVGGVVNGQGEEDGDEWKVDVDWWKSDRCVGGWCCVGVEVEVALFRCHVAAWLAGTCEGMRAAQPEPTGMVKCEQ